MSQRDTRCQKHDSPRGRPCRVRPCPGVRASARTCARSDPELQGGAVARRWSRGSQKRLLCVSKSDDEPQTVRPMDRKENLLGWRVRAAPEMHLVATATSRLSASMLVNRTTMLAAADQLVSVTKAAADWFEADPCPDQMLGGFLADFLNTCAEVAHTAQQLAIGVGAVTTRNRGPPERAYGARLCPVSDIPDLVTTLAHQGRGALDAKHAGDRPRPLYRTGPFALANTLRWAWRDPRLRGKGGQKPQACRSRCIQTSCRQRNHGRNPS